MPRTSVIIPARNEQYLAATIRDVLAKATGDIEVIAVLDGYDPPGLPDDPRVRYLRKSRAEGMRPAVNDAAQLATGTFLMKCDAHCMFAEGWDEVLAAECDVDWIVVPRRYSLDPVNWVLFPDEPRDAHYLSYPFQNPSKPPQFHGLTWKARGAARKHVLLDEEMSSQGSCWFQRREYFLRFGGEPLEGYGPFIQEFQQLGNRTWLSGGKVMINKKTWYAHWYKRQGQGYVLSPRQSREGLHYSFDFWYYNRWPARQHDLAWLVDRFWPVPQWPEVGGRL
jgi:glycosyltransferase involved in cell wall biosynthesis